jgi:isopenicillin-N N-acyltransferase-like protein
MNADGLVIGSNDAGGAADDSPAVALKNTPTAVLARRILEECGSVAEAAKLMQANKPASRSIFVVCDRQGGGAIEATPRTVVLRGDADLCVATNCFRSEELCVFETCWRRRVLLKAARLKMLGVADVVKKLDEANLGAETAHALVFEPGPLKLHAAFGDGDKSATKFPFREIDLGKLLGR